MIGPIFHTHFVKVMDISRHLNSINCSNLRTFIEKWRSQLDCELVRMCRDIYAKHRNFFDTSTQQILTDSVPVQNCIEIFKPFSLMVSSILDVSSHY